MDDCADHDIYTQVGLREALQLARRDGFYPGWNLNSEGEVRPRKKRVRIMEEDGTVINAAACREAITALGFQLEDNETWLLPHFFANHQVKTSTNVHNYAQRCNVVLNHVHISAHSDTYVHIQTPDDPLHQVYLGVWIHLLESVVMGYKTFLQQYENADKTLKFPDSHCLSVMARLGSRIEDFSSSHLGFRIPDRVTGFAATMFKKKQAKSDKTCYIEGRQHVLLMMVRLRTDVHMCTQILCFWF